MPSSKLRLCFSGGLGIAFIMICSIQHRAILRLREENHALRQQAEETAQLSAQNQRLAKRLAELQTPIALEAAPRLPAPQTMIDDSAAESSADPAGPTNLFALISHGGNPPDLTPEQVETYLKENNRGAVSLLTAFRASKDTNLLAEALEKYPRDPQVNYASLFSSSSPEERRQRVEAFKQSAPDNA